MLFDIYLSIFFVYEIKHDRIGLLKRQPLNLPDLLLQHLRQRKILLHHTLHRLHHLRYVHCSDMKYKCFFDDDNYNNINGINDIFGSMASYWQVSTRKLFFRFMCNCISVCLFLFIFLISSFL